MNIVHWCVWKEAVTQNLTLLVLRDVHIPTTSGLTEDKANMLTSPEILTLPSGASQ